MKKTVLIFSISAIVVATSLIWFLNVETFTMNEAYMAIGFILVVGFAVYLGFKRVDSLRHHEPVEDELSKRIMVKSSSLSYYISIYLWLLLMYMSDKVELESHTLIGLGIMGMAITFLLSWIWVKFVGLK